MNLLPTLSLVAGLVALIRSTHERRSLSRLPIVNLLQERFSPSRVGPLLSGLAAGTLIIVGPLGLCAWLGWVQLHRASGVTGTVLLLGVGTILVKLVWAGLEELIFRGAILPQIARLTNGWWGLAVSALLFSWGHLERTGTRAPDLLSLLVFGLDGVGFAIAYLATRSLWMPTLWHAAKNIWVWLLIGGGTLQLTDGLLQATYSGPPLWVGAANQAGLLDVMAAGIAAATVAAIYWRPFVQVGGWVRSQ